MKDSRDPKNDIREHIYALGHSERELTRLSAQARIVAPITRRYLVESGIGPGMRVLDTGSGSGDVALLVAELVGPEGEVVGTDISTEAVARAAARVAGNPNVSFRVGDPTTMVFERPFDAVVGRYILQYYADPADTLRQLASHVRPGGIVCFHERDWHGALSFPPAATYDRCCRWIAETFEKTGTRTRTGLELHGAYRAAGLPTPTLRLEAIIGGSEGAADWIAGMADIVESMLPEMERLGIATADEADLPTLAARLHRDVAEGGGVVVGRSEIGAWARKA